MAEVLLRGATIFDGERLHEDAALRLSDRQIAGIVPDTGIGTDLGGGILAPGLIDLQVNGGGGAMLGDNPTPEGIAAICAAHARLGTTGLLPTLITDRPETTVRVLAAGAEAARAGIPGFLGLHLEGPHLDPRRAGAHDPALIRPMEEADLNALLAARPELPALMVTLAPSAVTPAQISRLAAAGITVSLGHAECSFAEAQAAMAAGARLTTHLFNAMSGLGHREPGLVGATLDGDGFAGLIADGHHVAAPVLRIALAAKRGGAERLFLVSDAMAVAGTDLAEFDLGERRILRRGGRLTLADGTLAGADLTLPQAIAVMVHEVGVSLETALSMATRVPAKAAGLSARVGLLAPGRQADVVHLGEDFALRQVWQGGKALL